jgi:nitrite reductase/ring-hydroxylating ferredoxin subunit
MISGSGSGTVLCRLDDIADPGSRGVTVNTAEGLLDIMLIRKSGQVYGYLNSCPHTGGPLDWMPDQFLDLDRRYIQCATHDALFRIADGVCIAGPCSGEQLTRVSVTQGVDGEIMLSLAAIMPDPPD